MEYFDELKDDEIITLDFAKYWKRLKAGWKKVLWWTVGGFIVGCLIALGTPHKYMCVAKLAPELSSTATNRLSSVASMIGLNSSMMGTTDAVYPMVYPELVKSPEFVAQLFEMPVTIVEKKDTVNTDLKDYILNHRPKSVTGAILGAPGAVMGWIKGLFSKEEEEAEDAPVDPFFFTKEQSRAYKAICKCISSEIDKKTMVLTLKVTMEDRKICANLCKAVEDNLKQFVTKYRTEKAIHDRDYYKELYEQVKKDYYAIQSAYSRYVDSHQGVVLQSVNIERERLRNEVNLQYNLYSNTAQQLQTAEAKVQLETPVFAEVISPTVPSKSIDSRKKKALAFALIGMIIGAIAVCSKKEI